MCGNLFKVPTHLIKKINKVVVNTCCLVFHFELHTANTQNKFTLNKLPSNYECAAT